MTEAPPSRRTLLESARVSLAGAGVSDPFQEARWLWERVSREPLDRTIFRETDGVDPALAEQLEALVQRRVAGEPLAYVLGETTFRWLTILCDRRALIPRPESEGLVDLVLARRSTGVVADIGTGTGCLALSLAREGAFNRVIGVDQSAEALALAATNAERLGIPVHLVRGDLTASLAPASADVLVSNPPYVSKSEYEDLDASVKDWEPASALVTGEDGMEATRRLFYDGRMVVRPGGLLVMEMDSSRAHGAVGAAVAAGWVDVSVLDDLFGRARYLVARRGEEF